MPNILDFDYGTVIEQMAQIESSRIYSDTLTMSASEASLGNVKQVSEAMTKAASDLITPTTAASLTNIGKLLVVETTADAGTYLIVAISGGAYQVIDSAGAAAVFTAGATTATVYDMPNLESDLNYIRTKEKEILGLGNWFDANPTHPNQDATGTPVTISLEYLKNAHTKFQNRAVPVIAEAVAVANAAVDKAIADARPYTSATSNTGLPTANASGTPDSTNYKLTYVAILDGVTKEPVRKSDGTLVWGRLVDGATVASGTGAGTDVGVKFYTGLNDGTATAYTWNTADGLPTSVTMIYHYVDTIYDVGRDSMLGLTNPAAYILGVGDAEQTQDIYDLQQFVGSADGDTTPTLTNTTSYYALSAGNANGLTNPADTNIEEVVNALNDVIGILDFSPLAETIINNGSTDTISDMLNDLAEAVASSQGTKLSVKVTATVDAGTAYSLPALRSYKPNLVASPNAGKYMDVYYNGVLLQANATDQLNDYAETSGGTEGVTAGSITFTRIKLKANDRLTFLVRRTNAV